MTDIRPIDPHDETALRAWHAAMSEAVRAGRRDPLVLPYGELAASLREADDDWERLAYAAFAGDEIAGTLLLRLPTTHDRHIVHAELAVLPRFRGRGYGRALAGHVELTALAKGRTTLLAVVGVPVGEQAETWPDVRFARRNGFVEAHVEDHLVLPLPLPAADLAAVGERAAAHHPGHDLLSWIGPCPAEHLDAYVAMCTLMEYDVPVGDLDVRPLEWDAARVRRLERRLAVQGITPLTTAARAPDGSLVGYTTLQVSRYAPAEVYQDDTLVVRASRGLRLGAAMKARNLEVLQREFPGRKRVHTWNAQVNDPMQGINRLFGFRAVETEYEVQRILPTA
ncbi:hypothetical protein GCM10027294_00150 [Marinactinospora endophytica]